MPRTQLDRALSKLGYCSRTVAQTWIREGRVRVNGVPAATAEAWVDWESDRIEIEGASPSSPGEHARLYLALHKPAGYVTSRSDELGRKTIYDWLRPDLLPSGILPPGFRLDWIFPVGRLDRDSEGLLLLTNDGVWANAFTDPEFHVEKTYRVKLDGRPSEKDFNAFRQGLIISGQKTRPAQIVHEHGDWVRVTLQEGRNRQIRKMFHHLGFKVKRLIRISIGNILLGDLAPGAVKVLDPPAQAQARSGPRLPWTQKSAIPHED